MKLNAKRKGGWITPSTWLFFIYMFSFICSVIHVFINNVPLPLESRYTNVAILFMFQLFIYLVPFYIINENKRIAIKLPSINILNIFSTSIIILSFFSIAFNLPKAIIVFSMNLNDARLAGGAVEAGLLNTIASVSSSFYLIAIVLFFIYMKLGKRVRAFLLLLSSISEPIHVFTFAGRDGVVFWIFGFVFLLIFFLPYLPYNFLSKYKKGFILSIIALLIPFLMISSDRFSGSEKGTFNSLISYMGQGFPNYLLYEGMDNPPRGTGTIFPLYWEITGQKMPEGIGLWEKGGTVSWVFGTFLKSFNSNLGVFYTTLLGIILLFIFVICIGQKKYWRFCDIFIYLLFFLLLAQGVFYFKSYTRGGNLYILLSFFFYYFFYYLSRGKKCIIIYRNDINKKIALK